MLLGLRSIPYSTVLFFQTPSAAVPVALLSRWVYPFARSINERAPGFQAPFACRAASAQSHVPQVNEARADAVLKYWLGDTYLTDPVQHMDTEKKKIWFGGSPDIDQDIRTRFGADVEAAAAGKLSSWQQGYDALAFILLGDQFSRNVYRGTPEMYSLDSECLALAKGLIDSGGQESLHLAHRVWLYMPFMHSEEIQDQEACIRYFEEQHTQTQALPDGGGPLAAALVDNQRYARAHRDVLLKWGRFPHRNGILGRENTPEEKQGMKDGTIPSF